MLASGAALSISVLETGEQATTGEHLDVPVQVQFRSARDEVTVTTPRYQIAKIRRDLDSKILRFKEDLGGKLRQSAENVTAAMKRLHAIGSEALTGLFASERRQLGRVLDLCREAVPFCSEDPARARTVDTIAPIEIAPPFELLPLFDFDPPNDRLRDIRRLSTAASAFLGFRCIVRRTLPRRSAEQDQLLENTGGLPVAFFRHAGLAWAVKECHDIATIPGVTPRLMWKENLPDRSEMIQQLSDRIFNPKGIDLGNVSVFTDQIHHYACHCFTNKGGPTQCSIELADLLGRTQEVSISDLNAVTLRSISRYPRDRDVVMPLVFLNACGSSVIDPSLSLSWVEFFLDNNNRGFIGAETKVPDDVGRAFAVNFYEALMGGRGMGVGEALQVARWKLITRYNNPLGIVYTGYVNPDMRLRAPAT